MDEAKHKCKLCWKSFFNGRSLGGHMKSHMLHPPHPHISESASSSMADPGFALDSETESSKKLTRKRSRINRRSSYVSLRYQQPEEDEKSEIKMKAKTSKELVSESCTEQEPVSSVSDAVTEEEDVAFTLMMLSRDEQKKEKKDEIICEEQLKKWYECETCKKVFKSYQALGGHRASHKKKRALEGSVSSSSSSSSRIINVSEDEKKNKSSSHECPICLKVFSSGQALGGHKRSHATINVARTDNNSLSKRRSISLIDLNLPAPSEDEDLISSVV